ncbi:MAG TPA: patatin-like phospholipase family protein, partial [bacterium]|nr:patatin-like phospholipase family protein [bacterium]
MSGTGGRLGLALSGGGFRASLFHVGVLRRLAELGLLQHVKVISSVSGGSITAAQYMLRLHGAVMERRKQSPPAPLRTADYVRIAEAVEEDFRQGLRGNLRSRLLLNPVDNLINLLGGTSLGRRMARLYVQFLFRRTLPPDAGSKVPALRDLVVPLEKDEIDPGFPDLVLNATSLNSGGCFRLTAMEIGDPDLGYIRTDEEELVLWYKRALHRASRDPGSSPEPAPASLPVRDRERIARSLPTHLAWWRFFTRRAEHTDGPGSRSEYEDAVRQTPPEVRGVCDFLANNPFLGDRLAAAGPGALRRAKITAWYLRNQNYRERAKGAGQSTPDELEREFRGALEDLDANLAEAIRSLDVASLADLVLDLYYLRSAESLAWGFRKALKKLTLADAVAMSANFPPVFGPLRVKNLYSHHLVDAVALTDGGVHDNQGIDTLMQDRCTGIVASDASGSPKTIPDQSGVRSELLGRIGSILGNRLRVLQVAAL